MKESKVIRKALVAEIERLTLAHGLLLEERAGLESMNDDYERLAADVQDVREMLHKMPVIDVEGDFGDCEMCLGEMVERLHNAYLLAVESGGRMNHALNIRNSQT